mmetsp:Transcript_23206/g.52331  ORF Transcript_23206/g.52331 Transcript_23206/m.52331 type:complete len:126 (+) Transcript_23206:309-686(+)
MHTPAQPQAMCEQAPAQPQAFECEQAPTQPHDLAWEQAPTQPQALALLCEHGPTQPHPSDILPHSHAPAVQPHAESCIARRRSARLALRTADDDLGAARALLVQVLETWAGMKAEAMPATCGDPH